jgi:hypothetical protein
MCRANDRLGGLTLTYRRFRQLPQGLACCHVLYYWPGPGCVWRAAVSAVRLPLTVKTTLPVSRGLDMPAAMAALPANRLLASPAGGPLLTGSKTRAGKGYPRVALLRSTWKSGPAPAVTAGSSPTASGSSCPA